MSPITIITAPAGYGKSTLIAQWMQEVGDPVAWLSLTDSANSVQSFLTSIWRAVSIAVDDFLLAAPDTMDDLLGGLHQIADGHTQLTLVLDDYHRIENQDIHDAMHALIAHRSASLSLMILSRHELPLALGRFRADGLVQHLTEQDLAFTADETTAVATGLAVMPLGDTQIEALQERTGGWIAGIRLTLASLEHVEPGDVESIIDTLPAHRWLDDYVAEEILATLDPELRPFVTRTVILGELTPALCDAVAGIDSSARLIGELHRRLMIVHTPGPSQERFSYRTYFAESVERIARRYQGEASRAILHRRAAVWLEEQGNLEAAMTHAIAAEIWDVAGRILSELCRNDLDLDQTQVRISQIRMLPDSVLQSSPYLARWYLAALQFTGQMRERQRVFDLVGPQWDASGDPLQLGYLASYRAFHAASDGDLDRTLRHLYAALHVYPFDLHHERMRHWNGVANCEFLTGNDDVAKHAYRQVQACRSHLTQEQWWWSIDVEMDRANREALRGRLVIAESMYRDIVARLPDQFRSQVAIYRSRLAAIYLEWNELDRALAEIQRVDHDLAVPPHDFRHLGSLIVAGQVHVSRGDESRLHKVIGRIRTLYEQGGGPVYLDRLDVLQASLWLNSGEIDLVREWAMQRGIDQYPDMHHTFGDPDPRIVLIRVDLIDGRLERAATRLQGIIERAVAARRWAEVIPLLMWQVVVRLESGDEAGAAASLREALRHGRRGRFVRSLLTPGYDLRPFLDRLPSPVPRDDLEYLRRILDGPTTSRSDNADRVDRSGSPVMDPPANLTGREQQVLQLLTLGRTNSEIAAQLYLSRGTVKKHIGSILRKLGVSNRTAAATWARK